MADKRIQTALAPPWREGQDHSYLISFILHWIQPPDLITSEHNKCTATCQWRSSAARGGLAATYVPAVIDAAFSLVFGAFRYLCPGTDAHSLWFPTFSTHVFLLFWAFLQPPRYLNFRSFSETPPFCIASLVIVDSPAFLNVYFTQCFKKCSCLLVWRKSW